MYANTERTSTHVKRTNRKVININCCSKSVYLDFFSCSKLNVVALWMTSMRAWWPNAMTADLYCVISFSSLDDVNLHIGLNKSRTKVSAFCGPTRRALLPQAPHALRAVQKCAVGANFALCTATYIFVQPMDLSVLQYICVCVCASFVAMTENF